MSYLYSVCSLFRIFLVEFNEESDYNGVGFYLVGC